MPRILRTTVYDTIYKHIAHFNTFPADVSIYVVTLHTVCRGNAMTSCFHVAMYVHIYASFSRWYVPQAGPGFNPQLPRPWLVLSPSSGLDAPSSAIDTQARSFSSLPCAIYSLSLSGKAVGFDNYFVSVQMSCVHVRRGDQKGERNGNNWSLNTHLIRAAR